MRRRDVDALGTEESENGDCNGVTILTCGNAGLQRKADQQHQSELAKFLNRTAGHWLILALA